MSLALDLPSSSLAVAPPKLRLHPGVVLTALDAFSRRNHAADRVVGAVVGSVVESSQGAGGLDTYVATGCFAVPLRPPPPSATQKMNRGRRHRHEELDGEEVIASAAAVAASVVAAGGKSASAQAAAASEAAAAAAAAAGDDEDVSRVPIDVAHLRAMFDLHSLANPRETTLLGWFCTDTHIDAQAREIHAFFEREAARASAASGNPLVPPILITIDTELTNQRMDVTAYLANTITLAGTQQVLGYNFEPLEKSLDALDHTENVAIDFLLKQKKQSSAICLSDKLSDAANLRRGVASLVARIDSVSKYVDGVVDGSIAMPDPKIGRFLHQVIGSLASKNDLFQHNMAHNLDDLLMTVYLSNLTLAHLHNNDVI